MVGLSPQTNIEIIAESNSQQKGRNWDKYSGELDDPHFVPCSPIIERQSLSYQQEAELQRACAAALSNVQCSDGDDVGFFVARRDPRKPTKHDKHASFNFGPPKALAKESAPFKADNSEVRRKSTHNGATLESLDVSHPRTHQRSKPSLQESEQKALWEIRNKLNQRPKTSAAACIDYTEDDASSSSNRSSRTTPLTSAGITPASATKTFSELKGEPFLDKVEPMPPRTELFQMDSAAIAKARAWLADEVARREQSEEDALHGMTKANNGQVIPNQPDICLSNRPESRGRSIRASTRGQPQSGNSDAQSIHTVSTLSSTCSGIRTAYRGVRERLVPKRSSSKSSLRAGTDHGDEYLINASQVQFEDLDRPLPPLPGLDTYRERPRHLAELLSQPFTDDGYDDANKIINEDGVERILSEEELEQRKEEMSRAVLEKMTTGSIGSGGVISPENRRSTQTKRNSNLNESGSRPATQGSNKPMTFSTQSQDKIMDEKSEKGGEQRLWRQRMSQNIVPQGKLGEVTSVHPVSEIKKELPKHKKRNSVALKSPFLKRFFVTSKNKKDQPPAFLVGTTAAR